MENSMNDDEVKHDVKHEDILVIKVIEKDEDITQDDEDITQDKDVTQDDEVTQDEDILEIKVVPLLGLIQDEYIIQEGYITDLNFNKYEQFTMEENQECYLEHSILSTPENKKILSEATPHEKYIIVFNDILQAKNRKYIQIIKDLEISISELIVDTRYTDNSLHNLLEIKKWYAEISDNQVFIIKNTRHSIKNFKQKALKHLRIFQSLLLIFLAVWYEYHTALTDILPIMGIFLVFVAFQESTLWNLIIPTYQDNMERISFLQSKINED